MVGVGGWVVSKVVICEYCDHMFLKDGKKISIDVVTCDHFNYFFKRNMSNHSFQSLEQETVQMWKIHPIKYFYGQ